MDRPERKHNSQPKLTGLMLQEKERTINTIC